jgi:molecular chaperone GrpE (heat shock protein)
MNASSKSGATADLLTQFLPVLDKLVELRETYGEDEFGKQYNAVAGDMKGAFSKMGVTEFAVETGGAVDKTRMVVVDSEYSEEHAVDTVIRAVVGGMELEGNVIRMAECVASLGPELVAADADVVDDVEEADEDDDESEDDSSDDASGGDSDSGDSD